MYDMNKWQHIFKLDPNKEISDDNLEQICDSGTDAIIVGGTDHVTLDGVLHLLSRIRRYVVPVILEISNLDVITPGFDFYYIPMVMNSKDKKWMMDIHHHAVKTYGDVMDWDNVMVEGYCILNEDAKAFQLTNCTIPDEEGVLAYALMAEKMFRLPIFYIEYSGKLGDPALVKKVKQKLDHTLLFYGGGIHTAEEAKQMKENADVVIVGNSIYENFKQALTTVKAVKGEG
ncbi:heptaprenylglyceryl phosphate synthase [Aquibacillus sp. 3ASR75-11]|uniref:Heptaprenylglyceryl phosphate synthase n=1 Tax=Terrihalobacillus insolitus TaxID=2950438 RepID=A0A9X4AMJ9_9BACI|nr:heptaprenylglyceryl phosphate synthase [Terrihalobacillus insolitus]MDC3414190.1 heptaprenylglyceryl phosphate synthase [Terrihalobacillus insolitus]MDC3425396.1 heptaprenylglyceryl phosphate synthase [Terrihalobacillus insolitus]